MSRETIEDLNRYTLIGYTDKRGNAWHHKEGTDNHFPGPVPMERVLQLFGFEAKEAPLSYPFQLDNGDSGTMVHRERKIYYRSDNGAPLGIHGKGHKPHQYREWLLNNVEILLGSRLSVGQAGLLKEGAQAWVSVEMADTLTYAGVEIRPQLLAATSFDASIASITKLVTTIVVCDNTLAGGLSEDSPVYKVKHSSGSKFDEEKARDVLGLLEAYGSAMGAELEAMVATKVPEHSWDRFLQLYIPIPEEKGRSRTLAVQKRDIFQDYWDNDARVSPWRGTQFGVLQAANTWLHHDSTVQGMSRADRNAARAITTTKSESIETFDRDVLQKLASVLS